MTESTTTEGARGFRLTGEVDGSSVAFDLDPGCHVVGSSSSADVQVVSTGVSRRHAELTVTDAALTVRDLGSKNGTFINGRRIEERTADEGDWIGLGPVVLYLVRVHPDDARLAISLRRNRRRGDRVDRTTEVRSTARRDSDEPPGWIGLLNEVVGRLVGDEPDHAGALELLVDGLGATGGWLLEWNGPADPMAVVGRGVALDHEAAERLGATAIEVLDDRETGLGTTSGSSDRPAPLLWAIAPGSGSTVWGLVVSGDVPHRSAAGPLIEAVLRMMLHTRRVPVRIPQPNAADDAPELFYSPRHVIGRSPAMAEVYSQLRQLLRGDIPVLITGETGVGKEHIAETLHASSSRCNGPFIAVNCAAIPSELLEAELFGIESGVATGVSARKGKFQLARGGVLFLDEIGDMSLELQAKLLRALQALEVHPVGARRPEPIDVRIVTATNTDLQALIDASRFRRDLYYRVAGFTVHVPPLRARREDIPAFVEHFMRRSAEEIGKPVRGISVKALGALTHAPWPGNVRELEHEVRRLVYLCPDNQTIDSTMLSEAIRYPAVEHDLEDLEGRSDLDLETAVAELERKMIGAALARTRHNRSRAAKLLGISRNGLALKMDRLGIE